jgi:dolichol kinase
MWRTLYHIIGGMLLPVAGLFLPKIVMVVFLGILTLFFLIMELVRLRVPVVNQWVFKFYRPLARTEEKTRLTGTGYLLIASFISFLVFSREVLYWRYHFWPSGMPSPLLSAGNGE